MYSLRTKTERTKPMAQAIVRGTFASVVLQGHQAANPAINGCDPGVPRE